MKLTRKQREQVVELLRCAADGLSPSSTGAWTDATDAYADRLALPASMAFHAVRLQSGTSTDYIEVDREWGRTLFLEAAQRVEEGSWP